ncbi:unnamed protein product [Camellia sinensis]
MGTTTAVLAELWLTRFVPDLTNRTPISALRPYLPLLCRPISSPPLSAGAASLSSFRLRFRNPKPQRVRRNLTSTPVASMFSENPVVGDIFAAVFSGGVALSLLRLWGETAKRGLFDQVTQYYSDMWLHEDPSRVPTHRDEEVCLERKKCLKRFFDDPMERTKENLERIPQYLEGETKLWGIAGDTFDSFDDAGMLEVANFSLDELEMEVVLFTDDGGANEEKDGDANDDEDVLQSQLLRAYLPFLSHPIPPAPPYSLSGAATCLSNFRVRFQQPKPSRVPQNRTSSLVLSMFLENWVSGDIFAAVFLAASLSHCFDCGGRPPNEGRLTRKLVHVSVGLVFMLCCSGHQGAVIASLIPGLNIIKMLLIGLGIWKDEATVKSMSRFGDYRELLKGPLYYAATITLSCAIYWRSSPIAIAAICNLCAGDGIADIVGRRFGIQKIPYNRNKTIAGSLAMATAGFIASIGFMHYFSLFGYVQESWEMCLGFLVVSLAATLVESHPKSTELDDNLTVPLASVLVGSLIF